MSRVMMMAFALVATLDMAAAQVPSGYARSDGVNSVVVRGKRGNVIEHYLDSERWRLADLSAIAKALPATSDPVGYRRSDGVNALNFVVGRGEIAELYLDETWRFANLSQLTSR